MKKFSAILLIFALIFSFAACKGGDEEETTKRQYYKEDGETIVFENPNITVPEKLFNVVSVDDYAKEESKPNTTQSSGVTMIQKRYTLKEDNKKAIPVKVNSGSTEFLLGKTLLKELVENGWSYKGKVNQSTTLEAGKTGATYLTNGDGKVIRLAVKNNTSETVAVGECTIVEIGFVNSLSVEGGWADFTIGGSLNKNSSYDAVVKALGAPEKISVVEKYKGNDFSTCSVTLVYDNKAGDKTYSVSISYDDDGKTAVLESLTVTVK